MHQQHDMLKPVAGYIENIRLVPDELATGEWRLIADITLDDAKIEDIIGGFSVSGIEMLRRSPSPSAFVYLPYPHYNDDELVQVLSADTDLNVAKWIKKGADSVAWVVIGSVVAFVLGPAWDDVYKQKIAPRIRSLLDKHLPVFHRKGLGTELAQIVLHGDREVEVRLIPTKGEEAQCLRSDCVQGALARVAAFLSTDAKANAIGVERIVLFYNESINGFSLHRIEYHDGVVEHVA